MPEKKEETPHLLMFYGAECPHCMNMKPLVDRLEAELGVRVLRLEVWHNQENAQLMQQYDQGICGGVPFFYNTKNSRHLCGEAGYDKLRSWAVAHPEPVPGVT